MAKYTEEEKLKVKSLLAVGKKPKDIAEEYNVPYITILSWKKKMERDATGSKDVETLVKVDAETLHHVADKVKAEAPVEVADKIDKLVDSVTSLQQLEPKFHQLTLSLLERAEEFSRSDDLNVKEWLALSNGIGSLYANIFNKSGVNVNVLNQTQVNSEKLSMFKASMRNS